LSQIAALGFYSIAANRNQAENVAVRLTLRFTSLVFAMLILCLGAALAQDRDLTARGQHKTSADAPPPAARIDINHASLDELLKVPGMTPSWAQRIVRFRPYRTKQDLLDGGVVTAEVYERIKDYIIAHRDKQ
jgi:DNA uptake protein ComE-like DNA-binding protein